MEEDEVYESLSAILQKHQLPWLLEHVTDAIGRGKMVKTEVDVGPQEFDPAARGYRPRKRKRQELTTTEEFNSAERLALLLSALERGLAAHFAYANTIWQNLHEAPCTKITFLSEHPDAIETAISFEHRQEALATSKRIREAVQALRNGVFDD